MVEERTGYWRERIAEQERSGIPVQQFCKERGITEQSFYGRKRLRKREPARFALVETEPARQYAPKRAWNCSRRHLSGKLTSTVTVSGRRSGAATGRPRDYGDFDFRTSDFAPKLL
jgi:hypothetical protein